MIGPEAVISAVRRRSRRFGVVILALTTAVLGGWSTSRGVITVTEGSAGYNVISDTCNEPDPTLLNRMKLVVTTDTLTRRLIGSIPAMSKDSVSAVTDTSVCRRAAIAYGRSLTPPDTTSPRTVAVIRLGSNYYVVVDSTRHSTDWDNGLLFTSALAGTAIKAFVF